jgi:integrase
MQSGEIEHNPVPKVRYRKKRGSPQQGPELETLELFVKYVQRAVEQPYRGAMMIQLASGLRIGALLQLKRKDLERQANGMWILRVSPAIQKSKRGGLKLLPDITALKFLKRDCFS